MKLAGGIAVPGDYDGDGKTDVSIFSTINRNWNFGNIGRVQKGKIGDVIPVPAVIMVMAAPMPKF